MTEQLLHVLAPVFYAQIFLTKPPLRRGCCGGEAHLSVPIFTKEILQSQCIEIAVVGLAYIIGGCNGVLTNRMSVSSQFVPAWLGGGGASFASALH
jgi:hypothetical protein